MLFRKFGSGFWLFIAVGLAGCLPPTEGPLDEGKNPYFVKGKERVTERDYQGAIDAFEQALQENPRSALAHYELGMLFEQHGSQKEEDYVAAIFHYYQAIKLRPRAYPSENALQRIPGCKQELLKSDAMATVNPAMFRDLERLREENVQLRKQVELYQLQANHRASISVPVNPTTTAAPPARILSPAPAPFSPPLVASRETAPPSAKERPAAPPAPRTRTHTVKAGDTPAAIARQYRVKLDALQAANPHLDARRLKVGQSITLPGP